MQEKIATLLKTVNGKELVTDFDMDLFENVMLDSLGIAQLIAEIESNFDLEIDPEDIVPENFSTINEIVNLIRKVKG
jgi:acyl carrier protein